MLISSGLLVQADEGTLLPVMDLIRRNLPPPTVKSQSPCDSGWSQAPRRQQDGIRICHRFPNKNTKHKLNRSHNTYAQTLMDSYTGKNVKMSTWVNAFSCDEGSGDVSRSHVGNVIAFIGEIWLRVRDLVALACYVKWRDLASREGSGSVSVLREMVTRVGQRVALTSGFGYCVVEIWSLALFVEKRSVLACDIVLCYAHVLALRSVSLERRCFAP
ncbi:pentatricopeptide repeat-containing protein mitochondrial-like [Dorcoceras hygrometricum]|uniref:Pentatricopeptide repeat-containing protein mitochondrial-like n=1 Tax=Dorcoceras hygrometricum TaxID=472368 RepID=A0A2Z7BMN5_9LAMI|nr:pentatricopeptide repeat-containing protein mitochondrial-like [Dorcoceras hygrometricum]